MSPVSLFSILKLLGKEHPLKGENMDKVDNVFIM